MRSSGTPHPLEEVHELPAPYCQHDGREHQRDHLARQMSAPVEDEVGASTRSVYVCC